VEHTVSLVPLYGFVHGDTLGVLVLVQDTDSIADLGRRLQQAATVRVTTIVDAIVMARGKPLDPKVSVTAAGLSALDRVDLVPSTWVAK
jgi:hypothetical protein